MAWYDVAKGKRAKKQWEKAETGETISEWIGGGIRSYIKGSAADPRGFMLKQQAAAPSRAAPTPTPAAATTEASKDYSAELRRIAKSMMDAADPFRKQRQKYATQLSDLYKDPSSITESSSYKFRLGQGQKALERSMAAKGLLGSGNLVTEVQRYGQEMASTEFDKEANRLAMLAGAAPGSPAAGAQLGASLLGAAAGEDFNRGGYAAYAKSFGQGVPQPAIGAAPTRIDRNPTGGSVGGGTGIGSAGFDPFSPIAPAPGDTYNQRNQAIIAGGGISPSGNAGTGIASPSVDKSRSGSGWTSFAKGKFGSNWTSFSPQYGAVGGGYGTPGAFAPGTGYARSGSGGVTDFYGGKGTYDKTGAILDEESGFEAELWDADPGPAFSIWGQHF